MRERQGGSSSIKFLGSIYYMIKVTLAILQKNEERRQKGEMIMSTRIQIIILAALVLVLHL